MQVSGGSGRPRGACGWSCSCPWGDDPGRKDACKGPGQACLVCKGGRHGWSRGNKVRERRGAGVSHTSGGASGAHQAHQHPSGSCDPECVPLVGPTLRNWSWSELPKQWCVHYKVV